jgi:threonine aldolase
VPNLPDGSLDATRLAASILGDDVHEARTGLLCVENTQNMCGGRLLSAAMLHALAAPARRRGVPVHMDGARLFNAAVGLGEPVSVLAAEVDSVMFCLSKGLSAPVGSILAGPRDFIAEARRGRKLLGGGMRQAGILAAAGLLALTEMVDRLAEDHANARRLAQGLAELPGVSIAPATVESNILFFDIIGDDGKSTNEAFTRAAAAAGVLFSSGDQGAIRAVTHYGIDANDIHRALDIIRATIADRTRDI